MENQRILLVGFGKISSRIAAALAHGNRVWALARSERKSDDGIHYLQADVTDPAQLSTSLPEALDLVLYCLSPSERSREAYRQTYVQGLVNILAALKNSPSLKRLFFVSSTSVYHQDDGSIVSEHSQTKPVSYSGEAILEAEALLQEAQVNSTIVRFSGIYGGNRTRLIEQVCEGRRGLSQDLQLSNRIHEDDCVGFLLHLMQLAAGGEALESCYLASDSCPVDMNEVVQYIADQHGIQLPADRREIPRRAGNKRCDNSRMLATGYQLKYPDYREGYRRQPSAS